VQLDDRAGDAEAQAAAPGGAVARLLAAVEAVEDALALLGRDARPVVVNRHHQAGTVGSR
jgi:hypothetical protein